MPFLYFLFFPAVTQSVDNPENSFFMLVYSPMIVAYKSLERKRSQDFGENVLRFFFSGFVYKCHRFDYLMKH